eukprot:8472647-Prorocentrum_lima.AAC.1
MLREFGMQDCNPAPTPLMVGTKLPPAADDEYKQTHGDYLRLQHEYQTGVGLIIYLMTESRPDLAHACGQLARYMTAPRDQHLSSLKRVFRYIKGTRELALKFSSTTESQVVGYADASHQACPHTGKGIAGWIFFLHGNP